MFQYVSVFLLTNVLYCSLGNPVTKATTGSLSPLAKSLSILANSCENEFLVTQIKSKQDTCNISTSGKETLESEFECYIFYDINSQLCAAFRGSNLDLSKTYTQVNEVQNLQVTCNQAKNWKFTKLMEYPVYNNSEKIYKGDISCVKACGAEDLLSEETNFYCKYFQWGTEMLQTLSTNAPSSVSVASGANALESALPEPAHKPASISVTSLPVTINKLRSNEQVPLNSDIPDVQPPNDAVQPDPAPLPTNTGQAGDDASPKNGQDIAQPPVNEVKPGRDDNVVMDQLPKNSEQKPLDADDINENSGKPQNTPENIDDNDNHESDFGEYLDEEENPGMEADPKLEDDKKDKTKLLEHIVPSDKVEVPSKELFNSMQDGLPEDHFFSFFLTAIILVIFLYVLYHNKSKFRKVILGLLVEGRQSGRRRNSRGHEYRRLDTLEQAMSTNSAAPPSKIIY